MYGKGVRKLKQARSGGSGNWETVKGLGLEVEIDTGLGPGIYKTQATTEVWMDVQGDLKNIYTE